MRVFDLITQNHPAVRCERIKDICCINKEYNRETQSVLVRFRLYSMLLIVTKISYTLLNYNEQTCVQFLSRQAVTAYSSIVDWVNMENEK